MKPIHAHLAILCACLFSASVGSRAASYVVDSSAPGAADANPGTEEQPFKTVQRAADLAAPGDVIFVMAGKYPERVNVKPSGAPGRPIVFRAMPRHSSTVEGFDLHGSYVQVQGFDLTADKPAVAVQLGGTDCEILDNHIHEMMVAVAGTTGTLSPDHQTRDYSAVAHNRIAFNRVYHCEYGFILGGNDWLVENNEVNRLFMYASGRKFDDCDYSRFFGKGCVQRYNYYHGSTAAEIRVAHVDCLQTFTVNGEIAQNLVFQDNTCFDFHQLCMVESAPHLGSVSDWTFERNIVSANAPGLSGGWGPDIIQTLNVTIAHNTISNVRWAAIGLRGAESVNGQIRNNILCHAERAVIDGDEAFSAAHPVVEYNLTCTDRPAPGTHNLHGQDPRFVDEAHRNFRLRQDSPAIGAGQGGATVGALEYPNVYYVDPNHPAASDDPAWGYPGVPLATLAKACAVAQPGETIVLRGGVYREVLRPKNGVTIRAMPGENVRISGADLIEGWMREPDQSWSASLPAPPRKLLRDGQPWSQFRYDQAAQRISVKGGDPRLHRFESLVRAQAFDIAGRNDVRIERVSAENTLDEAPSPSAGTGLVGAKSSAPAYPLKKSANGRYLVDSNGAPFLIAGDAPQALMVKLSEADADLYFSNRVGHGFNSVWINLLCRPGTGGRKDGATYDGLLPFTAPDDLSTPNEAYFARCDRMMSLAEKHGLLVILDPAETIDHLKMLIANGPEKCRAFGRYLGQRYGRFPNLLWMSGNDFQTWRELKSDEAALAVAQGIREADPGHLQTVELNYEVSGSLDDPRWAPLIDLSCAYTYYPTYAEVLKEYNRTNFLPVIMIESDYEFEQRATPAVLRREEYWSLLSGAAGQVYGCGPIWPFADNWKSVLNSTGAVQMAWVKALFEPRAWFELVPDQEHQLVVAGYGTFDGTPHEGNHYVMTSDYVTAARTTDGRLAMAYMPSLRPLKIDLSRLAGPVTARWFDPSRGTFAPIKGSPFPNSGKPYFIPPGNNADGDGDWVLVLETGGAVGN